jgi:hypothetical protein
MNHRYLVLAAALAVGACANPGQKTPEGAPQIAGSALLENIPLQWQPSSDITSYGALELSRAKRATLSVEPFTDLRSQPGTIGENREKTVARAVTTGDSVGPWVSGNMAATLAKAGVKVVSQDGRARLSGEVRDFFVVESDNYVANVTVRVTLRNHAGRVVWTGTTGGSARHFGRSYKAENYCQTLSDAVVDATHNLLENARFRAALGAS